MTFEEIGGCVCAPHGYRASGVVAQIKNLKSTKKDCALVVSDTPATVAGTFTTNVMKAPPISWSQGVCIRGKARAIFINSGNANAATGQQGLYDAQTTAELVAAGIDALVTEVCVLSTGVIGVPLPMDRITNGINACVNELTPIGGCDAAVAIMTTDTVAKEYAIEVPLSTGIIRIGAIAKGAGMIAPNMATLISVVTTDATIDAEVLRPLLREIVDETFNCVCIDNDMSTSDAVICLANGAANTPAIEAGTNDHATFAAALRQVCLRMAQWLVRDGEGATKFLEIQVKGAPSNADARKVARAIAHSMLCKTAFFGEDANWGRIACAAGYSGVQFDPTRLSISLSGLDVVHEGLPTLFDEEAAAKVMKEPDITIRVFLGEGPGTCTFWTSDLSYKYVEINADYRT